MTDVLVVTSPRSKISLSPRQGADVSFAELDVNIVVGPASEVEALRSAVEVHRARANFLEAELATIKASMEFHAVAATRADCEAKGELLEAARAQAEVAGSTCQSLRSELSEVQQQLLTANADRDASTQQLAAAVQELGDVRADLTSKLESSRRRAQELSSQFQDLVQDAAILRQERVEKRAAHCANVDKLEAEKKALLHSEACLTASVGALREELRSAQEHAARQQASLEALAGERAALQAELVAQDETLAAVRRRACDHEAECKRLLDQLEARSSEVVAKRQELQESCKVIAELEKKLQAADMESRLTARLRAKDQQREDALQASCDQLKTGLELSSKRQAELATRLGIKNNDPCLNASRASTEAGSGPASPASSMPSSPRSPRQPLTPSSPQSASTAVRSPKVKMDQSRGMLNHNLHIEIVSSD